MTNADDDDDPVPPEGEGQEDGLVAPEGQGFSLPPEAIRSLRDAARRMQPLISQFAQISAQQQAMLKNIAAAMAPALEAQARLRESLAPMLAQQRLWAEQLAPAAEWAEQIRQSLPKIDFTALADAIKHLRSLLPPNWPLDLDPSLLDVALYEHGLPLAWVPRESILVETLAQHTRESRLGILLAHQAEVLDDCVLAIDQASHEDLAGQAPLATAAVAALRDGHVEAAQALAVVIADTLIKRFLVGDYTTLKHRAKVDLDDMFVSEFRQAVALAPLHVFLTEWHPKSQKPSPEALSRHVTIHQAHDGHFEPGNALVGVMFATSLLRTFHEQLVSKDAAAA